MAEAPETPVEEAGEEQEIESTEEAPLSEFVEAILAPISSSKPCGEEAMFVDDYLTLRSEINRKDFVSTSVDGEKLVESGALLRDRKNEEAKGSFAEETEGPDFRMIADTGARILQKQSKDLMVAGWMTYGLYHRDGSAGLAEGVTAIQKLAETYWDDIFPKSLKARKNAIEYLDNFNQSLKKKALKKKFVADDRVHMEQVSAGLQALQALCAEKIEDREQRPSLHGLAQTVTNVLRDLPKPAPPKPEPAIEPETKTQPAPAQEQAGHPASATPAPTPAATPAATPVAAPAAAAMPDIAIDVSGDIGASLVQAAVAMRTAAPADPMPYRLMRLVRWGQLNELPKNDSGKTVFKAPPAQRRTKLSNHQMMSEWDKLMEAAEEAFAEEPFHFWLDLQRYMARGTGAKFSKVAEAIEVETVMLLKRLPELPELFFDDGIPFASDDTKGWIEDIQKKHGGGGEDAPVEGDEGNVVVDLLAQQYEAALQKLNAGEFGEPDLKGALEELRSHRHQDHARKDEFRRELYQAMLCMEAGRSDVAQSILVNLNNQIDRHVLAEWDPDLALNVWSHLHRCYQGLANQTGEQEYSAKARGVFEKISLIDPGFALTLLDT